MRAWLALLVSAAVLVPSSSAHAQAAGGSILWLVPPAGRIELDRELRGTLSSSDFYGPDDIYVDVWELEGSVGSAVTVDMKSDDFDTLLFVVGPGLAETLYDDDSGGDCDSRIRVRFLEDGIYRVAATTNGSRTTGVYTLFVSANPPPASGLQCGGPDPAAFASLPVAGNIVPGEPVSSSLDAGDAVLEDGSHAEVWELAGEQGQTVTIRLESEAFDSFLYVTDSDVELIVTDDDSGGDLHSQIVITWPATATYRIIASSVESGGIGPFLLTVTQ